MAVFVWTHTDRFFRIASFQLQGRYAQESGGCTLSQVASLYVGFGVCSVTGRIAIGRILDLNIFRLPHLLTIIMGLNAISNFLCPFARTFVTLLAGNCCFGFCDGCFATVIIVLIPTNAVPSQRPQAFGLYLLAVGITYAISPPVAGKTGLSVVTSVTLYIKKRFCVYIINGVNDSSGDIKSIN